MYSTCTYVWNTYNHCTLIWTPVLAPPLLVNKLPVGDPPQSYCACLKPRVCDGKFCWREQLLLLGDSSSGSTECLKKESCKSFNPSLILQGLTNPFPFSVWYRSSMKIWSASHPYINKCMLYKFPKLKILDMVNKVYSLNKFRSLSFDL